MRQIKAGKGHFPFGQIIYNNTDKPYEIHGGYSTVRFGYVSALVINPGECARKDERGDAESLSVWSSGGIEDFDGKYDIGLKRG